jgi:exosortase
VLLPKGAEPRLNKNFMSNLASERNGSSLPSSGEERFPTILSPWAPQIALLLIGASFAVWATGDAWQDIAKTGWKDEESSHILLVPIVVLWLMWENRGRFSGFRRLGTWAGPPLVAFGGGLYLYGSLGWSRTTTYAGAVIILVGCMLSVLGTELIKKFAPAVLALAFLVPVPGVMRLGIAIPLGTATAQVAEHFLLVFGVPVERSGTLLSINQVDVTIAEACNGLRMVLSLFFVSYVVAFSGSLSWYVRAIVLLAAPLLAILCNVIRLIPTLYLYGYASKDWAEMFHDAAGWAMLAVSYVGLIGIIRLIQWTTRPGGAPKPARVA